MSSELEKQAEKKRKNKREIELNNYSIRYSAEYTHNPPTDFFGHFLKTVCDASLVATCLWTSLVLTLIDLRIAGKQQFC